ITKLRLHNFKGHRETSLVLPRFAILVGDNGSGKTTVLEAVKMVGEMNLRGDVAIAERIIRRGAKDVSITLDGDGWAGQAALALVAPDAPRWSLRVSGMDAAGSFKAESRHPTEPLEDAIHRLHRAMGAAALYRFRAEQVAASAYAYQADTVVGE